MPQQQKLEEEIRKLKAQNEDMRHEFNEFARMVCHDVGAPFRQIEGFAQMIMGKYQGRFDDRTEEHFNRIINRAEKGKNMLSALSAYSKLTRVISEKEHIHTHQLVADVLRRHDKLIVESQAVIKIDDLPDVYGEKDNIQALFYELMHNALLYQSGEGTAEIELKGETQEGGLVRFTLKDNGIGFYGPDPTQYFGVFRRGVKESEYEGYGLGLATAERVVKNHDCYIRITETNARGSTLEFTLPTGCVQAAIIEGSYIQN